MTTDTLATVDDTELGQLRRACASYVEVLAARDAEIERLRELLEVACRWHQEFPIIREALVQ